MRHVLIAVVCCTLLSAALSTLFVMDIAEFLDDAIGYLPQHFLNGIIVGILVLPGACVGALIARRGRRVIPAGHCQTCAYDLTGNTSGTCPECGTDSDEGRTPRATHEAADYD